MEGAFSERADISRMSPRPGLVILTAALLAAESTFPAASSRKNNSEIARILHRPIRALTFPENSNMGIFFALAVPLADPDKSISLSYFFEASYDLPDNSTVFEPWYDGYGLRRKRSIDRTTVYRVLENKFEGAGYPGRNCLLRSICETSESPVRHNGILGDIVHVIFTPSTSRGEDLPWDIIEAEMTGRSRNCSKYYPMCPVGLFDLIGTFA